MRSEAPGPERAFDSIAAGYDAWYATPLGRLVDRLEKEAVLTLVGGAVGGLTLDLSCGTGNYALALAERGFRVVGVDVSEFMLRVARAKSVQAKLDIPWLRADASVLPFRSGAFELVTLILGLEFMAEPGRALGEAHRVLKSGGDLVVAILNRGGLWTLWRRLKRLVVPSLWRGATFLRPDELRDLLRARGFEAHGGQSAVHFLPLCRERGLGWLERWEAMGARWMPARASFVAMTARHL